MIPSLPSGMDAFIQKQLGKADLGQPATIGHYELGAKIGQGGRLPGLLQEAQP